MLAVPPSFDVWLLARLARGLGRFPALDLTIQRTIEHNVLGGLWYGAALFVLWTQSARAAEQKTRLRLWTILLGTGFASLLTLLAARLVVWAPPSSYPPLAHLYPDYLDLNSNPSSFPSQSTAIYSVVAAGVHSVRRRLGQLLWAGVALLVALPRMYVGGHYLTDVLAGLGLGAVGYLGALKLERHWPPQFARVQQGSDWRRGLADFVIFLWILEVATELRDIVWLDHGFQFFLSRLFRG